MRPHLVVISTLLRRLFLRRNLRWLVAGGIAAVLVATVTSRCYDASVTEWETRISAVQAQVVVKDSLIEDLKQQADTLSLRADSLSSELEAKAPEIRERIVTVREEFPAETPADTARDTLIDDLQAESDGWQTAYDGEVEANVSLWKALDLATASTDSLSAVLNARPGKRSWYIPRLGIGPFVGACTGGPCAGVGVQLSWEIRL